MIELVLMYVILLRTIYPLAESKGRCPVCWTFLAGISWLLVEILIIGIYVTPFAFLVARLGKWNALQIYLRNPEVMEQAILATCFVYLLALLSGIFSSILVRRYLARQSTTLLQSPPLPFEYQTI